MYYTDDSHSLNHLVERCSEAELISMDTEFERTSTYYPRPALLQFRIGNESWLLDPVAISDLCALTTSLTSQQSVKIMHSASEDLAVIELATGKPLAGLFDTQIAAAFAGHGFGLGYHALVDRLLGISVSKDQTRSNWLQRPLSDAQLTYAEIDVLHLEPMYHQLYDEVTTLGRSEWLVEETQSMIERASRDDAHHHFIRLAARVGRDDNARGRLRALCQWREDEARRRNRPRKHILDDPLLVELAREQPGTRAELEKLPAWKVHRGRIGAQPLLEASLQVNDAAACALPADSQDISQYRALGKALKNVIAEVASSVSLQPEMLAPKRLIDRVIVHCVLQKHEGLPEEFDGWRGELLRAPLLEHLHAA